MTALEGVAAGMLAGRARRRHRRGRGRAAPGDPPERRARGGDDGTPGHDLELAAGFLYGEGIVDGPPEVGLAEDLAANTVEVRAPTRPRRRTGALHDLVVRRVRQGCARGGGGERGAHGGRRPPDREGGARRLPDRLRQPVFERTGGLHATGLFTPSGEGPLLVREDVGRHNAMDKVIGRALLDGMLPLSGHVLCVSGRLGFELVQKAARSGAPVLVGVGAPTSLAIELADDRGLTLAGFARGGRERVRAPGACDVALRPCSPGPAPCSPRAGVCRFIPPKWPRKSTSPWVRGPPKRFASCLDKYRRYRDTDGMRTGPTRAAHPRRPYPSRAPGPHPHRPDRRRGASVHGAGLSCDLARRGGGRGRLHQGRRVLELRLEGGPLPGGLRAAGGRSGGGDPGHHRGGSDRARGRRAHHPREPRAPRGRRRLAGRLLRVLGPRPRTRSCASASPPNTAG